MIKLTKTRAAISPDFADMLKIVSRTFIQRVKADCEMNPSAKTHILVQNKMRLAAHLQLLNNPAAFDMEITKLRNMAYAEFGVATIPGFSHEGRVCFQETTFLTAVTKDIICKADGLWNLGPYRIMVPLPLLGVGTGSKEIQFIPLGDEYVYGRFYHHTSASDHEEGMTHPEQLGGSTCWGDFNVTHFVNNKAASDLFRTFLSYLSVANMHSLLYHGDFSFAKPL